MTDDAFRLLVLSVPFMAFTLALIVHRPWR
jgi:hypothetical protein